MTAPRRFNWLRNRLIDVRLWHDRVMGWLHRRDSWVLLGLLVVALAGVGLAWKGKPLFRTWKSARAVEQAREFMRRADHQNAQVALQVAFLGEPTAAAYAVLADYLELVNSSEAVEARRLAADLEPTKLSLRLAVVTTALQFGDTATARAALASCSTTEKQTEAYLRALAAYALIAGEFAEADRALTQLFAMVGVTAELRLLHAALRLNFPDAEQQRAARRELEGLANDAEQRVPALRVLVSDAVARRDPLRADEFSRALSEAPGATFTDWLNAATAQRLAHPATGLEPAMRERIAARAQIDPLTSVQYARWLLLQQGAAEARQWLAQLSPEVLQLPAVGAIRAEVAALSRDWEQLRALIGDGAWGAVVPTSLDFAFAARVAREYGEPDVARRVWLHALEESANAAIGLRALSHLASAWSWPEARRDALLQIVRRFPNDGVTFLQLAKELRAARDTRGLRDLYRLFNDGSVRFESKLQDWALLALLATPTTGPNEATRTLQALHTKRPENSYYKTNYAFALCLLQRAAEAAELIDELSEAERNHPERAPYVAFIYASAGREKEARAALRRAPPPAALLPEEAKLLTAAAALCGG